MVSPAASAPHNRQQTIQSYPPLLAPLASVFNILNWIAFVGWCYILYQLISFYLKSSPVDDKNGSYDGGAALQLLLQGTKSTLILLEGICVVEVGRIFFKDLPGNLTLGVILHTIRITALLEVLPRAVALASSNDLSTGSTEWTWTVPAVLLSWAVTEVGRYPMYLAPSNNTCRKIRLVLPLVTFPMGALAEFCGAYQVFFGSKNNNPNDDPVPLWLQFLLVLMMLVNGLLGPYLAYPHLLKKGLPVLGLSVGASPSSSSATNKKPKLRSV